MARKVTAAPDPVKIRLVEMLLAYRDARGMICRQMAEEFGTSVTSMSNFLRPDRTLQFYPPQFLATCREKLNSPAADAVIDAIEDLNRSYRENYVDRLGQANRARARTIKAKAAVKTEKREHPSLGREVELVTGEVGTVEEILQTAGKAREEIVKFVLPHGGWRAVFSKDIARVLEESVTP